MHLRTSPQRIVIHQSRQKYSGALKSLQKIPQAIFRKTQGSVDFPQNNKRQIVPNNLESLNTSSSLLIKTEEIPREQKNFQYKKKSIIPKASDFVYYSPNKYQCPYYIKPRLWGKINSAPRFDEEKENDKINNFYRYMHERFVDPNPFFECDQSEIEHSNRIKKQLAELPEMKNYKKYLKERKLRPPSFLLDI